MYNLRLNKLSNRPLLKLRLLNLKEMFTINVNFNIHTRLYRNRNKKVLFKEPKSFKLCVA